MGRFDIDSNVGDFGAELGNIVPLAGQAGGALSKLRTIQMSLNTVVRANPYLALFTLLIAFGAFIASKFQPVIDILDASFAALNAVGAKTIDFFGSLLGLTESNGLSFAETAKQAFELERATQRLADRTIELMTVQAELSVEVARYREAAADATLSDEERIEALEGAAEANRQLFINERELAAERVRIIEQEQGLASNQRSDNAELAEARTALINLNAQEASQNMALLAQRTALTLRTQMAAKAIRVANAATAERQRIEDERITNDERELRQDRELDLLEARGATELELFEERLERAETEAEREQIMHEESVFRIEEDVRIRKEADEQIIEDAKTADDKRIADEKAASEAAIEIAEAEMATKEAIQDQTIGLASQLGDTLTSLAGENKSLAIAGLIVEQAAGVAEIIVNTLRANAKAVTASPITFGQPFVAINTISAGLSIAAAVGATASGIQQINSTPGPSASGVAGAGGATSIPFGPQVTVPDVSAPTDLGTPTTTQQPNPMIFLTPTSGPGSAESTIRKNTKRNSKMIFGNSNSN